MKKTGTEFPFKSSISKSASNLLQSCKVNNCSTSDCNRCIINYIIPIIDSISKERMLILSSGEIQSILGKTVVNPPVEYDVEKLVGLYSSVLINCNGCMDHSYRKQTCPTSILLFVLEAVLTKDPGLAAHLNHILSEKDWSQKYIRIKKKDPDMAGRILASVKMHIAFSISTLP